MDGRALRILLCCCLYNGLSWQIKAECKARTSSVAIAEEPSGKFTNYDNQRTDTCASVNWSLKLPLENGRRKKNVMLQIIVKYLSVTQSKKCGSIEGDFLKLPGDKYICNMIRSGSPKCFIFTEDPVPTLCKNQLMKMSKCQHTKLGVYGWPGVITYFNNGRPLKRGKGVDLEYSFINCTEETTTASIQTTAQSTVPNDSGAGKVITSTSITQRNLQNTNPSNIASENPIPESGLNTGTTIGIVAGIIALIILIIILSIFLLRKRQNAKMETIRPQHNEEISPNAQRLHTASSLSSTREPHYIGNPASVPPIRPVIEKHAYEGIIMDNTSNPEYETIKVRGHTYLKPTKKIFASDFNGYEVPITHHTENNGYIDFR